LRGAHEELSGEQVDAEDAEDEVKEAGDKEDLGDSGRGHEDREHDDADALEARRDADRAEGPVVGAGGNGRVKRSRERRGVEGRGGEGRGGYVTVPPETTPSHLSALKALSQMSCLLLSTASRMSTSTPTTTTKRSRTFHAERM
jgi:hypothetical protein